MNSLSPIVKVENLSLSFGNNIIFSDVNFLINKGEFIGIKGESGTGKTNLIYCLTKIIPTFIKANLTGDIFLKNQNIFNLDINEISKTIGVVLQNQDTQIFFNTVFDEVIFGMENLCFDKNSLKEEVEKALDLVGIPDLIFENCSKLSGGQKKLVILASVLAMKTEILILDEVLSQIDETKKELVMKALKEHQKTGGTIIIIEHDEKYLKDCDRVLAFDGKKGLKSV